MILFCELEKNMYPVLAGKDTWAREIAQHLRELAVLPEDHRSVPSTHTAGHSPL